MPSITTFERIKSLALSAYELKAMTDWPDALVEDYLTVYRALVEIASLLDGLIDKKLEEIDTDFIDGSIPFVSSGLLIEDNDNFFWDETGTFLKLQSILGQQLQLAYDATNLTNFETDSAGDLTVTATGTTVNINPGITTHEINLAALDGIIKATAGLLGVASGGTDYEYPLTFGNGLTRTLNAISNDLITGKAGGQTIIGGTAASENLLITSTSNATKGKIAFGSLTTGMIWDAVNNLLGIGLTPTAALTIKSGSTTVPPVQLTSGALNTTPVAGTLQYYNGTWHLVADDNLNVSGYVTGKKTGVFAYLTASDDTTITTASTYYPIEGTFNNDIMENFSAATTYTPGIKYSGALTQYFEIDWHATILADQNTTTVHLGLKKNGALSAGSVMAHLCKNSGQKYNLSGTCVLSLAQDDEIQLVITSDGDGDVITVDYYTATINEFFD